MSYERDLPEKERWEKHEGLIGQVDEVVASILSMGESETAITEHLGCSQFGATIMREIQRSQRYNHYLAAAVLRLDAGRTNDCIRVARKCFRDTDILGLVTGRSVADTEGKRGGSVYLGVLMPETNRDGGRTAVSRAANSLQVADGYYGVSVYPDDATDAPGLLAQAMAGVTGGVSYSHAYGKGGGAKR